MAIHRAEIRYPQLFEDLPMEEGGFDAFLDAVEGIMQHRADDGQAFGEQLCGPAQVFV